MRLVLLGAPGAGKGTQATRISDKFKVPHISTGDMLRDAVKRGTDAGVSAKAFMDKGALVPDVTVIKIVTERISQDDARNGFILDGFPRTINQAEELAKELDAVGMPLDCVLSFETSEEVVLQRLTGRRVCPACGGSFHIKNMPPKTDGVCDFCGAELIQRDDDKEVTIKKRLTVYHEQTQPLLGFYKQKELLHEVKGNHGVDELFEKIKIILNDLVQTKNG